MDSNKNIQIQVKSIPVFTVLKNGSILKNIFLFRKRSYQESDEEILLVGRHPHCNITLEHPSISRYHLRIHANPFSHTLSVVDLSSVHGTWVSGKRIEPEVHVQLKEGDRVRIGGSSRIYELHWVPLSQVYDVDEQFVPAVYTIQEVEEETNEDEKLETDISDDELGCPNLSLGNKSHNSPLKTLSPLTSPGPNYFNSSCDDNVSVQAPLVSETISATDTSVSPNNSEDEFIWLRDNLGNEFEVKNDRIITDNPPSVPNCSKYSCDDTEVEHSSSWKTGNEDGEIFTNVPVQAQLVVSEDISGVEISRSLNNSEDQLIWLGGNLSNELEVQNERINNDDPFSVPKCSKSSFDAIEVEHLHPWKTGNGNDELFITVPVQAPLVGSEDISETEISRRVSKSEDELNWLRDDLSNESELQNDGIIKEEQLSVPSSKSFCDDTASSPCKTGNGNGECFIDCSIQAPPLVSISEIEVSDKQKDQSNWVRDNLSNEFEQPCHGSMNDDDLVSVDLLGAIKMHKEDAQNQNISDDNLNKSEDQFNWLRDHLSYEFKQLRYRIMKDGDLVSLDLPGTMNHSLAQGKNTLEYHAARSKEIGMPSENEQENKQKSDVSVPVALLVDGANRGAESFLPEIAGGEKVNVCCESKSIDHGIMEKESVFELLTDGINMDQEQPFTPDIPKAHFNPESMKNGVSVPLNIFDSLDGNELELYMEEIWKKDEHNHFTMSKKAVSPTACEEKDISNFSKRLFTSVDEKCNAFITDGGMNMIIDKHDQFVDCEEVSLSSQEKGTKSREMKMEESYNSNYPQTILKAVYPSKVSSDLGKKRWTMVVDTDSLLHSESLKHLKLLEGLRGTQLFVPKIVIRELVDIKSQDNFLKRSTKKASLALKWIDECVMNTRSWIHLDDGILHSSTAEPEVLETALHLHKQITDRRVIILSNNLTLKIKAMAEGIMCEEAEEFFRSLVNPFSERFMWVGSSAIGPTWCFVDDEIMRQKFYACGLNGSHKLKGLKLLVH